MKVPIPEYVRALRPYVPGKPIEQVQRELGLSDVIKLASNENPLGPSPRVRDAVAKAATGLAMYPEGDAPNLRTAVARHLDVPEDTLVFGNGSDEVIHILCQVFLQPGDNAVQGDPSFAMYEIYTAQCDARSVKVPLCNMTHDLDAMVDAIDDRTRIVFVANPNNPTGTYVDRPRVERFLSRLPEGVLLVMDEAYHEYVDADKFDLPARPRRPRYRDPAHLLESLCARRPAGWLRDHDTGDRVDPQPRPFAVQCQLARPGGGRCRARRSGPCRPGSRPQP